MTDNWCKFTKKTIYHVKPELIFKSWTSQEGLESWFLRLAEFTDGNGKKRGINETIQAGDQYKWMWYGYDDTIIETGKILELNHSNYLKFTFTNNCIVSIKIMEENYGTILELQQENIPLESDPDKNLHVHCLEGWTFYLANLKSILQGGIDLRNKENSLNIN